MSGLFAFHFLRPLWLLMVVPALLVAALRLFGGRKNEQWKGFVAPHLLERLLTGRRQSLWLSPEVLLVPVALITAIAMAGPAYRLKQTPNGPDNTTLIVVVDLSSSMKGRDIGPSRIGRLRLKLRDLINLRRGSHIGIIAVAGSAHVVMPPTNDIDALIPYVDVLEPELMPSDGERFLQAAPLIETLAQADKGPTVALIAADSIPPEGAKALGALVRPGLELIGWEVGTKAGAPAEGVPGLDRAGFSALERQGAELVELSLGSSDLRQINDLLERARTRVVDPKDASLWEDSGYGLAFLVAAGILYWFRRGWVLGRLSVLLFISLSLGGCGGSGTDPWLSLWLTPDQQGRRLFEQGKYEEAATAFEDPMWKGIAYYTAHDWKKAAAQFARVDTPEGLFNLANAHAQAKEIASAIAVYNRALKRRPTFLAARKNRDYFEEVLAGLEQTTDFDELKKADDSPSDPTKANLRPDQKKGPKDLAAEASQKKAEEEKSLSSSESDEWMKRVATNPADFLRAKFATQEAQDRP